MVVRLLPKYEVDKRKAQERQQQIDEGMKIAARVDTLREVVASEEKAFNEYRTSTLSSIGEEIRGKQLELEELDGRIKERKSELETYMGPLDLQWAYFKNEEKKRIEGQVGDNQKTSHQLALQLRDAEEREAEATKKLHQLDAKEADIAARIAKAAELTREAKQTLATVRNESQRIISQAEVVVKKAEVKQQAVEDYEARVKLKEEDIAQREQDVLKREFAVLSKELQLYSPVKQL